MSYNRVREIRITVITVLITIRSLNIMTEHQATPDRCPCGSQRAFTDCCQPLLSGAQQAATPEALMRSRYSAHATGNPEYVIATYHSSRHAAEFREDIEQACHDVCWQSLEIVETTPASHAITDDDQEGWVEFIAHFSEEGHPGQLHERSRFVREQGLWRYIDGTMNQHDASPTTQPVERQTPVRNSVNVGRNDPCPCGSGKKYKKCCG